MVQKRETKAINRLCVREILSLSFVCGAYFSEFRGQNLVCFVIAYNFNGKYAPEAGKTRMRTAFFTPAIFLYSRCKLCLRYTAGNFNENPSMRARASEHSSNFCEQLEQRPNFSWTFKLDGSIQCPSCYDKLRIVLLLFSPSCVFFKSKGQ